MTAPVVRLAVAVLIVLVGCARAPGAPSDPSETGDLPAPLQRFRAVSGGDRWDQVQVIASRGTIELGGMSGSLESLEDVPSGRSRQETMLGSNHFAGGFDGSAAWSRDPGGEVVHPDAAPALAQARMEAWLTRRGYFSRAGARYRTLGEREVDGRRYQVVEAMPSGGVAVELWLDHESGRLARTVHVDGMDTVVTTFEDYRDIDGVEVAFRVVVDRGDPRDRATITLSSVRLQGALADSAWAPPATDLDRLRFTGAEKRSVVPFDLVDNHIYVNGQVDGKPVRLLVDTGGVNLLTPSAVRRLGLTVEGKLAARGAGEEKVDLALAHGQRITVGEVELRNPVFYVLDLGQLADVEGEDLDGLVGFELFHRLVVRIDYPGRTLTLSAPDGFVAPAGATAVGFELDDRIPVVAGSIDGVPGKFTVDTGSRASLTAHGPFVRQHNLVARYRPRFDTVTGWGVGGPVRSHPVRFGVVSVGGVTLKRVAGDLFTGDKGAFTDPDAAANLGGGILTRFVVTFDYRGRTMYFEAGPAIDAPFAYDRVGVFVLRDGERLRVGAVTRGSPAEKAEIKPEDRIVAIDGTPVSSRRLTDWRDAFRESKVGSRMTFTLERDGARRDTVIVLEDLLP